MRTYRVSNVESFRRWESDEDGDTEQLIADIKGGGQASQAMRCGTAFHKILELAQVGQEFERIEQDGFVFVFRGDIVVPVTPIRELRARKVYVVDGEEIGISGQVDTIEGLTVSDYKTTGNFNPERYLEGFQWRLYLSIFGARQFRWGVFELKEVDDPGASNDPGVENLQAEPGADPFALGPFCYEVLRQHDLTQYAYPGMEEDCQRLVERFARFVRERIEAPVLAVAA